jgi:hypothetical protein
MDSCKAEQHDCRIEGLEMGAGAEHEIPPPVAMMGLITGYWVSQAVGAVALLGVADHFGNGPRSCDDLARDVEADRQALFRVLRLLASIGVFAEVTPRSFGLTALGETLRSDTPGSVRNFAITETAPGHWQPWGRLNESIRTGQPMARKALGMELFEWYAQNEAGFFSAAMGNLSALAAGELVRVYDFSAARKVADVGGAHGSTCPMSSQRLGRLSRSRDCWGVASYRAATFSRRFRRGPPCTC